MLGADGNDFWRRGPESNRASRICNPVHNRFVTAPYFSISVCCGKARWLYRLKILFTQILSTTTDYSNKKGQHFEVLPFELEREKRLELSTYTLARYRSTN
jgi:hypothetical protein